MLGWARCGLYKKGARTRYSDPKFLHLAGSMGHVVDFDASAVRNVYAQFSCSCGTGTNSTNSALGHVMPKLAFCIRSDVRMT
jgi:hypothetical protein